MGILAVVSESVDEVIRGKVERNRKLEVIREQKRKEQEAKEKFKEEKLEDMKDSLRKKRKRKIGSKSEGGDEDVGEVADNSVGQRKGRKSVSFA